MSQTKKGFAGDGTEGYWFGSSLPKVINGGSFRNVNRGEPTCTFVNEIIGLPLALSIFPKVYEFSGDAVLELVEPGLYRKGWRVGDETE